MRTGDFAAAAFVAGVAAAVGSGTGVSAGGESAILSPVF